MSGPGVSSTVGGLMRARRKALRLTMEEVATAAGITPQYLQRVETNDVNPSVAVLQKIASALNVEPGRLIPQEEPVEPNDLELWCRGNRLTPEQRKDVEHYMELVVAKAKADRRKKKNKPSS